MGGGKAETERKADRWTRLAASSVAPLALCALGWLAARAAGFETAIDWQRWQLLDRVALAEQPWHALRLLHAQPPGLNAAAAVVLRLAALAGTAPETVVALLFAALAALAAWLVHRLLLGFVAPGWALAGTLLLVAAPGYWVFAFDFFHPLPLLVLAAAQLLASRRYLEAGRPRALAGVAGAAVGLAWTSALYPPPFALGLVALVVALAPPAADAAERKGRRRRAATALLATALLVALWPAKNGLVFGRPINSSWLGFSLSNMSGVRSASLSSYLESGDPGGAARRWWQARAPRGAADEPLLVAPEKSEGGRNWNHYVFLYSAPGLEQVSRRWMLEHPVRWLTRGLSNYARCTRPVDVHPYLGTPLGPAGTLLRGWRALWKPAFADLRPLAERMTPGLALHGLARDGSGAAIPYTLFGVLLLPALMAAAAVRLGRRRARGPFARTALVALAFALWTVAAPCLSDGSEANRMRFSATPALLVLAAFLLGGRGPWTERAASRAQPDPVGSSASTASNSRRSTPTKAST